MMFTVRAFLTSNSKPIVTKYSMILNTLRDVKRDAFRKYGEDSAIHITMEDNEKDICYFYAYKEHGKKRFKNCDEWIKNA